MAHAHERRRSPRVDLVGKLHGEFVSVDLPILVREISLGGMSIETSVQFDIDTRQSFILTLGDGAGVLVKGRIVYSRRVDRGSGSVYVSGIQFLEDDGSDAGPGIDAIIRRVQ
jgi:hypothetical protein